MAHQSPGEVEDRITSGSRGQRQPTSTSVPPVETQQTLRDQITDQPEPGRSVFGDLIDRFRSAGEQVAEQQTRDRGLEPIDPTGQLTPAQKDALIRSGVTPEQLDIGDTEFVGDHLRLDQDFAETVVVMGRVRDANGVLRPVSSQIGDAITDIANSRRPSPDEKSLLENWQDAMANAGILKVNADGSPKNYQPGLVDKSTLDGLELVFDIAVQSGRDMDYVLNHLRFDPPAPGGGRGRGGGGGGGRAAPVFNRDNIRDFITAQAQQLIGRTNIGDEEMERLIDGFIAAAQAGRDTAGAATDVLTEQFQPEVTATGVNQYYNILNQIALGGEG